METKTRRAGFAVSAAPTQPRVRARAGTRTGLALAATGLAVAIATMVLLRRTSPPPGPIPEEATATAAAPKEIGGGAPAADGRSRRVESFARTVQAVAALREKVENIHREDVLAAVANRQAEGAAPPDVPAQMAPASQALSAREQDDDDAIAPTLTSREGRPHMPRPDPSVMAGILEEIATTQEPGVRSGLTATYRDMVEGLDRDEMVAALDRLDRARARRAH
jgi:hypothetical protein